MSVASQTAMRTTRLPSGETVRVLGQGTWYLGEDSRRPVTMTVPKGANTGRSLRLKGKGVPRPGGGRGDEYINLKVVLPEPPDSELEGFVSIWQAGKMHNPRQAMGT